MLFGRIVKSRKLLRIYRELRVSNMKNNRIMALSFDTGGTVLDWHSSFKKARFVPHPPITLNYFMNIFLLII